MEVEAVQNVTVKTTWFTGTTNGLRIKTWESDKRGYVRGVTFSDSTMSGVDNPIIIDQNYCPDGGCGQGSGSGIKISDVRVRQRRLNFGYIFFHKLVDFYPNRATREKEANSSGMEQAAVAMNRKVVLREYISRAPREDDMVLVDGGTMALRVPEGRRARWCW
ncbi:hypothetical protein GUJ93_ZPchr0001g30099 [Zizania palustris]|uniref:Uncharacterized protein n=1 Tax=Zizania palustris TaxID=103762 RepID=A0A8J5SBR7_ZIZPA|nr:hypothetical protein GUJ93_ZPchr0001g30099 [Zizania palustris]